MFIIDYCPVALLPLLFHLEQCSQEERSLIIRYSAMVLNGFLFYIGEPDSIMGVSKGVGMI